MKDKAPVSTLPQLQLRLWRRREFPSSADEVAESLQVFSCVRKPRVVLSHGLSFTFSSSWSGSHLDAIWGRNFPAHNNPLSFPGCPDLFLMRDQSSLFLLSEPILPPPSTTTLALTASSR